MKRSTEQILLSLWIVLGSVYAQDSPSRLNHNDPESNYTPETTTEETNEMGLEQAAKPQNELFSIMMVSFASSCGILLVFFCIKLYCDYKIRNTPVIDLGPFGDLTEISVSDLTIPQRQAILKVLFADENKTLKFHKKGDDEGTDVCLEIDEECPTVVDEEKSYGATSNKTLADCPPVVDDSKDYGATSNNTLTSPPSLPVLSMDEMDVQLELHSKNRLKLPSLKRRQMFSPLPNDSYDDDDDDDEEMKRDSTTDEEINKVEKIVTVCQEAKTTNFFDRDDCPICIDEYDENDSIIRSKHCKHYFHKECIMQWLEKNFMCPCCRVEMITAEEIGKAITIINTSYGVEKKVHVRSEAHDVTPPASPLSSVGSSVTPHSPLS